MLKKAGVGDHHEESLDESIRNSYRRAALRPSLSSVKGTWGFARWPRWQQLPGEWLSNSPETL